MSEPTADSFNAGTIVPPRVVAIVVRGQVVELWHMRCDHTDFKEQEVNSAQPLRTRMADGRLGNSRVFRRQQQEWGHFVIHRYQATRVLPWLPSLGLAMLIPGTLLAAGSTAHGIMEVPLTLLVLQSTLITLGGAFAMASGWRVISRRVQCSSARPLETLGVCSRALGFRDNVAAADVMPSGYRAGRFKGTLEVQLPVGDWIVVEEYATEV